MPNKELQFLRQLEDFTYWKYRKAQVRLLNESSGNRANEIHVNDLLYPCMRRVFYGKLYGFPKSSQDIDILADGVALHDAIALREEEGVDGYNEYPLEWECCEVEGEPVIILGKIDDLLKYGDDWIIVDKKHVNTPPSKPRDHHVLQVKMYAVMLEELTDMKPRAGVILYRSMDRTSRTSIVPLAFTIDDSDYRLIKDVMIARATTLYLAMKHKTLPPKVRTWMCENYCPFVEKCALDEF